MKKYRAARIQHSLATTAFCVLTIALSTFCFAASTSLQPLRTGVAFKSARALVSKSIVWFKRVYVSDPSARPAEYESPIIPTNTNTPFLIDAFPIVRSFEIGRK